MGEVVCPTPLDAAPPPPEADTPTPVDRMTEACENITLRAVKIITRLKNSHALLHLCSFNVQIISGSIKQKQKQKPLDPQFKVKVPIHTTITE